MAKAKTLTGKQKLFVAEYLIDLNATRAAIAAGYSKKSANQIGSELLGKTAVRAAIEARNQKRLDKLDISAEKVLQEIALLGFANMADYIQIDNNGNAYVDLSKLTREQAAAIQEIKVDESAGGAGDGERERVKRTTFKLADKGLNLERLGRHLKLFTDKVELNADDSILQKLAAGRKRLQQHG